MAHKLANQSYQGDEAKSNTSSFSVKYSQNSVCEVSMASISLFYVFFFQIRDHINSFQALESYYFRKDNREKIFTGK